MEQGSQAGAHGSSGADVDILPSQHRYPIRGAQGRAHGARGEDDGIDGAPHKARAWRS